MIKDLFPLKLALKPSAAFAGLAEGRTGWAWPLGIYAAATLSSALLLANLPPEFMARLASDLPMPAGGGFASYLAAGLPGGLGFAALFCALLAVFSAFIGRGRLVFRFLLLCACAAAYGAFFAVRMNLRAGGWPGWAAAAAALLFAAWAARRAPGTWLKLVQAALAVCLFSLASDAVTAIGVLADSTRLCVGAEYFFSLLSLVWLVKAAGAVTGLSAPRAFAALLPALLAAFAFAFSLLALGAISPKVFMALMLM
jgi:hypothetical protein